MADIIVNLDCGAATADGQTATPVASGSASLGLDVGEAHGAGPEVGGAHAAMTLALGVGSASTAGGAVTPAGPFVGGVPVPATASTIGVRSNAQPYFAAWMQNPTSALTQIGGSENSFRLTVALHSLPVQLSSPDEVHALVSMFEAGGEELFYLGVTPQGEMVSGYRTQAGGSRETRSGVGLIAAGPAQRQIGVDFCGMVLELDGAMVNSYPLDADAGWFSFDQKPVVIMFFNRRLGNSKFDVTIYEARVAPEGIVAASWSFNEASGSTVAQVEAVDNDYGGQNLDLTIGFYDPQTYGFPRLYGDPPNPATTPPGSIAPWDLHTQYRDLGPPTTDYREVS